MANRDCNVCVYSTREGGCRVWDCKGTKTVEDIKEETKAEMFETDGKIMMTQKTFNKLMDERYKRAKAEGIIEGVDTCIDFVDNYDSVIADYLRDAFKD